MFATLAAAELGFMNMGAGSLGFSFGFFGNDCDPDVALGVEEVEALSEGGSCLIEDLFGGTSSTTLNKSRSNSAFKSKSMPYSFFTGGTGAEGVVCAAIWQT